jgi:hypothetical protein
MLFIIFTEKSEKHLKRPRSFIMQTDSAIKICFWFFFCLFLVLFENSIKFPSGL